MEIFIEYLEREREKEYTVIIYSLNRYLDRITDCNLLFQEQITHGHNNLLE